MNHLIYNCSTIEQSAQLLCDKLLHHPEMIDRLTFSRAIKDYIEDTKLIYEDCLDNRSAKILYILELLTNKVMNQLPFFCDYNVECHRLIEQVSQHIQIYFRQTLVDKKLIVCSDNVYKKLELTSKKEYFYEPLLASEKQTYSQLYSSIKARDIVFIKNLLDNNKIDLNKDNQKSLYNAIVYKSPDIINVLIEYGADISYYYYSPIINSYRYGSKETTSLLLSKLDNMSLYQDFSIEEIKKRHRQTKQLGEIYDLLEKVDNYRKMYSTLTSVDKKNDHEKNIVKI